MSTLMDTMIAVAVLGIGATAWIEGQERLDASTRVVMSGEALVRIADQEVERARACRTLRCLEAWKAAPLSPEDESWLAAGLEKSYAEGPNGTQAITVVVTDPSRKKSETARALVAVDRRKR